jgi:hypothetical protein
MQNTEIIDRKHLHPQPRLKKMTTLFQTVIHPLAPCLIWSLRYQMVIQQVLVMYLAPSPLATTTVLTSKFHFLRPHRQIRRLEKAKPQV